MEHIVIEVECSLYDDWEWSGSLGEAEGRVFQLTKKQ
jgi:hypothetical protein